MQILNKLNLITNFNFEVSDVLPSVFSSKRIMRSGESNFVGNFDIERTPYMIEPLDFFSPYNPKNVMALMKGHQLGFNASFENGICYRISECPTNIMLVSANDELAKKAMNRINRAIDGFDLRHLIRLDAQKKTHNRASGDTAMWKQFSGGSLISFGGQSPTNMRSNPIQIIIADECDTYKLQDEKAGSFVDVMDDRTSSYGASRKLLYGSTPLLKHNSIIYSVFLQGDQRYYNMPCPKCNELITFDWYGKTESGVQYGILFDVKKNRVLPKSVRYRCPKCENDFEEKKHKTDMLHNGKWIPTAEPIAENYISYQISSLYSPVGMKSWLDYAVKYQSIYPRAGFPKTVKLQSFHNSVLGLTWEAKGKTPKITKLQNNTRDYKIGEVPFQLCKDDGNGEIVFLTCTCDLNGIMNGELGDDVRIDYEVAAWSERGASYSIDAGSIGTFKSKVVNKNLKQKEDRIKWTYRHYDEYSVWPVFMEIIKKKYSGINILISGVDTGHFTEYANDFVKLANDEGVSVLALKGDKPESFRMTEENAQTYKKSKNQENLYLVHGNLLKDNLADYMELESTEDYQPTNFLNFPNASDKKYDYPNYFSHYQGEQKKLKKNANNIEYYLWERKHGKNNHFWDCKVYNFALRNIISDIICKEAGVESLWTNVCHIMANI